MEYEVQQNTDFHSLERGISLVPAGMSLQRATS